VLEVLTAYYILSLLSYLREAKGEERFDGKADKVAVSFLAYSLASTGEVRKRNK